MPEKLQDKTIFTLLEVSRSIQKTIQERYSTAFWVKAEMNKLNLYKHSGHCYPELVEKQDGKVIAQLKAILWRDDYLRANTNFLATLKEPLKDGIKILFLAKISYDPAFGLSLTILEIDPAFTLGDLEREKQESIAKLKEEGIYEQNKLLSLARLPQRIAIISVESSKGFADFTNVLKSNPWNYAFFYLLFPSLLQGDKAVKDIIKQLKRIQKVKNHFDAVAIIRGGGGDVGLSCYNNYDLARTIARFPLPVLTGIGHATNETVSEMISHTNAITPTKLADFLLQQFHNFSVPVQDAEQKISKRAIQFLAETKNRFDGEIKLFKSGCSSLLQQQKQALNYCATTLTKSSKTYIPRCREIIQSEQENLLRGSKLFLHQQGIELKHVQKNLHLLHPDQVLKRGFSITLVNGKAITKSSQVNDGDLLTTQLYEGKISSRATQKKETKNERKNKL